MSLHVIRRGLDIPIKGQPIGEPAQLDPPTTVAYAPTEFRGLVPRLDAKEGDEVKAGAPLFHDKAHPDLKLLCPVAGRVKEVRRGRRRVITDIVVERTGDDVVSLASFELSKLREADRDSVVAALFAGGMWPALRTRPLDRVADPADTPQAVLICGTETGPLQPGADALLSADDKDFVQAAVYALRTLTPGKVFLTTGGSHPAVDGLDGVEAHTFRGPHPSGDPGVQVNYLHPPMGTGSVWYVRAWDAARIGRLLLEGRFPAERVYAAVGPSVKSPRLVRTVLGAPVADVVGAVDGGRNRWIRGSALTGEAIDDTRWAGFYSSAVTVIPDEVHRDVLGWITPQLGRWSASRTFLMGIFGSRRPVAMNTGLYGGHRAMIPVEQYRQVVATPDIDVPFLFRSIVAGDLEESLQLGMLDLTEEEAALLTYVCPAKLEFDVLLRQGLEQYHKEM